MVTARDDVSYSDLVEQATTTYGISPAMFRLCSAPVCYQVPFTTQITTMTLRSGEVKTVP